MSEDDNIQKRKEAAAKIAPNFGKKHEKMASEEAVEAHKDASPSAEEQKEEARQMRAEAAKAAAANVRSKEAASEAKSEDKREETAEQEADKWQGLAEEAKEAAIPEADQEYTVQAGDSLWAIADKFYKAGGKWNTIYEANKEVIGDNPSLLRAGQVLKIPQLTQ
jgi:nucleoid-associated protein YgaU